MIFKETIFLALLMILRYTFGIGNSLEKKLLSKP